MREDMYLSAHVRYYMREVRRVAYAQFLESYKSVTLDSMAAAFDVSVDFLDTGEGRGSCTGRVAGRVGGLGAGTGAMQRARALCASTHAQPRRLPRCLGGRACVAPPHEGVLGRVAMACVRSMTMTAGHRQQPGRTPGRVHVHACASAPACCI